MSKEHTWIVLHVPQSPPPLRRSAWHIALQSARVLFCAALLQESGRKEKGMRFHFLRLSLIGPVFFARGLPGSLSSRWEG